MYHVTIDYVATLDHVSIMINLWNIKLECLYIAMLTKRGNRTIIHLDEGVT